MSWHRTCTDTSSEAATPAGSEAPGAECECDAAGGDTASEPRARAEGSCSWEERAAAVTSAAEAGALRSVRERGTGSREERGGSERAGRRGGTLIGRWATVLPSYWLRSGRPDSERVEDSREPETLLQCPL